MKDNEAITSEIVATAHIENFALKLFMWADRVSIVFQNSCHLRLIGVTCSLLFQTFYHRLSFFV